MKVEAFLPHRDPFLFIDEVIEVSDEKIDQLVQQNGQFLNNCVFNPQEFEKDDDTNWHIAYLTATSNCRSQSYGIALLDLSLIHI